MQPVRLNLTPMDKFTKGDSVFPRMCRVNTQSSTQELSLGEKKGYGCKVELKTSSAGLRGFTWKAQTGQSR